MKRNTDKHPVIAFIPVRGGSKGIPNKNIKLMAGKPLVWYAVTAALQANSVSRVVVSTDCDEIRHTVLDLFPDNSRLELHTRSTETASDTASTESVMLEYTKSNPDFDTIILIQATSPLIQNEDIERGLDVYFNSKLNGVLSVVEQKRFLWNSAGPQNYDPLQRPRRQDMKGNLVENGAFYITGREKLLENKCRISPPFGTVKMSEASYFEVDEPSDWVIAENLIRRQKAMHIPEFDFRKIKAVVLDFDGVFTDNKVLVMQNGDEAVVCSRADGMGIDMMKKSGLDVWVISKERNPVLVSRCNKLGIECYYGVDNKLSLLKKQLKEKKLVSSEIIYVGNDINDIECLAYAGIGVAVSDAYDEAKDAADIILNHKGGNGAIRELSNILPIKKMYKS